MLYPLKFHTIYKDKIWGGQKIKKVLGKDFGDLPNCGETWEVSGVQGNISVVKEGLLAGSSLAILQDEYKAELMGKTVYDRFPHEFPLLIKFIDANDDLSIQVHPDDTLAAKRHDSFGKTEMWYILQADDGATLISGFNQPLDKERYLEYFESGRLMEVLNKEDVEAGDLFYLPAGRVHTIGKGLLLAEIQQTSDITYRIYDFDRKDAAGNTRELHVEEALDAIDFNFYDSYKTSYDRQKKGLNPLVKSSYFETNKLSFDTAMDRAYGNIDSFKILIGVGGKATLHTIGGFETTLNFGEVVLVPASVESVSLTTNQGAEILETYVPTV